jgi:hypothetical protein
MRSRRVGGFLLRGALLSAAGAPSFEAGEDRSVGGRGESRCAA